MNNPTVCGKRAFRSVVAGSIVLLAASAPGRAQAPAWNLALTSNNGVPRTGTAMARAVATDAAGNVYLTGSFRGTVRFGITQLVSAGGDDLFVTKWDAATQQFAWASGGGGTGQDGGSGIAVSSQGVFVTGSFASNANAQLEGRTLNGAGGSDFLVAKYADNGTGGYFLGWLTNNGGTGSDYSTGIAAEGRNVYVTGTFASGTNARVAGQVLAGAGGTDAFVAKYVDTSTGTTPATSAGVNAWAVSAGGTGADYGQGVAVAGTGVFATGNFASASAAVVAGQALAGVGGSDVFVAKYVDTSTGNTTATSSVANGWAVSGGGTGDDFSTDIAVSGPGVFVTGGFATRSGAVIAGRPLAGVGAPNFPNHNTFVAKYLDTGAGLPPALSSVANGWAISGGGVGDGVATAIAVRDRGVFIAGQFDTGDGSQYAGQALTGAGNADLFLAKYVDTSIGTTPATSSVANGWATTAGDFYTDYGFGVAISGQHVYTTGFVTAPAAFGSLTAGLAGYAQCAVLARLTDPTLTPLATQAATPTSFTLSPNPARTACTVRGAAPYAALAVLDALGRTVTTATADATGMARLALPAGLPPGMYVVRGGKLVRRLTVE